MTEQVQCINFPNTTNKMHDIPRLFLSGEVHLLMLSSSLSCRGQTIKSSEKKKTVFFLAGLLLTSSFYNTCPLAFFFCLKAVVISTTATVPELRAGIGLLIIVPVDFVLAAGALFQSEETAGINRRSLCGGKGTCFFLDKSLIKAS